MEGREMRFLACAELRLFAAQPATSSGDLHPLTGAHLDQVGFELGDHRQDVEQQPPDGVGRVVDGSAEVQLDLAGGQLIDNVSSVRQRPGEPIELRHHERAAPGLLSEVFGDRP
jgi:hypothetical protein